jgi:signal peptidase
MLNKIGKLIYTILLIGILLIGGISALSALGLPQQHRIFVVQSGSMEPAIKTGSVVITGSAAEYKVGDIITYKLSPEANIQNPKYTVTHRIVEISGEGDLLQYRTKGDANNAMDSLPVTKNLIVGKTIFSIPYFGYPVTFVKTQMGFVLLIVVPATIIVYSEILNIKKETKKLLEKRKNEKHQD